MPLPYSKKLYKLFLSSCENVTQNISSKDFRRAVAVIMEISMATIGLLKAIPREHSRTISFKVTCVQGIFQDVCELESSRSTFHH